MSHLQYLTKQMLGCKKLPRDLQSGDDDRLGGEIQTNGEDGAGDTD